MSMTKKLTKHGNSYALVIDRPILDLLGIDIQTLLNISTPDGNTIVITPANRKITREQFKASLAEVNAKYATTFKNLAE